MSVRLSTLYIDIRTGLQEPVTPPGFFDPLALAEAMMSLLITGLAG